MDALARSARYLLMAGGVLMVALEVILAASPASSAIYGFFLVTVLLGLGVLGTAVHLGERLGRSGRVSAWVAAIGGMGIVVLGAYAIGTDQFVTDTGANDPLGPVFAVTSMAWMLGSVGFAIVLLRARAIPALAAWLVVAGMISAVVVGSLAATSYPALSYLSAVPFGLGWILVGTSGIRTSAVRMAEPSVIGER